MRNTPLNTSFWSVELGLLRVRRVADPWEHDGEWWLVPTTTFASRWSKHPLDELKSSSRSCLTEFQNAACQCCLWNEIYLPPIVININVLEWSCEGWYFYPYFPVENIGARESLRKYLRSYSGVELGIRFGSGRLRELFGLCCATVACLWSLATLSSTLESAILTCGVYGTDVIQ